MTEELIDPQLRDDLLSQIESFISKFWKLHKKAARSDSILTISGIVLAAGTAIAGFLDHGIVAGVLGVAVTMVITAHTAFDPSARADFFHVIHNEAKGLRDRVRYRALSREAFETAVDELAALRNRAAQAPRGKGIQAVRYQGGES